MVLYPARFTDFVFECGNRVYAASADIMGMTIKVNKMLQSAEDQDSLLLKRRNNNHSPG